MRSLYNPAVYKHELAIELLMRRRVVDLARSALIPPYVSAHADAALSVLPSMGPRGYSPSAPGATCPPMLASELWSLIEALSVQLDASRDDTVSIQVSLDCPWL